MKIFNQTVEGERAYLDFLQFILDNGDEKTDRTGTGTLSHFGAQLRFDMSNGFPLFTTKKVHFASITHELLWFLSGDTKVGYLQENNVRIWNDWATAEKTAVFGRKEGDLGPIYGHQWRNFGATEAVGGGYNSDGIDQIQMVIDQIKNTPDSRRIIVTGWNPSEVNKVALPPCHTLFQFFVSNGKLSCQLYQRSCDSFLGLAFNIPSYMLLTCLIAKVCNLEVGEFVWTGGDCHIYSNHIDQVRTQLSRDLRPLPTLVLNPDIDDIFKVTINDMKIESYDPHPAIKAPVAV